MQSGYVHVSEFSNNNIYHISSINIYIYLFQLTNALASGERF